MIAIDTNVLLRYLLNDDADQAARAGRLFDKHQQILITDVVLVETLWTLAGKKYGLNKEALTAVIDALFKEPKIRFEHGQAVWAALHDYKKAKRVRGKSADFSDALIVNKARIVAEQQAKVLKGVYTFDLGAQQLPGTLVP